MPSAKDHAATGGPEREDDPRQRIDMLYRDHAATLRRRLRARLGSSDEASEMVHDAFARLLGAKPSDGVRDPAAFLNCLDMRRHL